MNIEIPFNKWSKSKLAEKSKTATSRNQKYGDVGDIFEVEGVSYQLDLVVKLPLWFIAYNLYKSEGCQYPQDFIDVWIMIHRVKGFIDNQEVWYHHFKEIEKLLVC